MASSSARGLGQAHRKVRERLLARHHDGAPCPCLEDTKCRDACPCRPAGHGLPMYRDPVLNVDRMPLEADHGDRARSQGGTVANRLMLAVCNRSRGDGTHAVTTETRPEWWSRTWF